MADEKDRFGDKLHQSEKAMEDQWARQQDAELIKKMQGKSTALHCPKCNSALTEKNLGGIHVLACPNNDGAWLDASALQHLSNK